MNNELEEKLYMIITSFMCGIIATLGFEMLCYMLFDILGKIK